MSPGLLQRAGPSAAPLTFIVLTAFEKCVEVQRRTLTHTGVAQALHLVALELHAGGSVCIKFV